MPREPGAIDNVTFVYSVNQIFSSQGIECLIIISSICFISLNLYCLSLTSCTDTSFSWESKCVFDAIKLYVHACMQLEIQVQ